VGTRTDRGEARLAVDAGPYVEVGDGDVGVDGEGVSTALDQRGRQAEGGRGLATAALAAGDGDGRGPR
jgi:hypothetical protein